jgi:hypothetical protein
VGGGGGGSGGHLVVKYLKGTIENKLFKEKNIWLGEFK